MGLFKNILSDAISEGIGKAVGKAVEFFYRLIRES